MNTAFFIARRYLFAKKSTNAINIISAISMVGVFVGSAALIIILSVFNGFEGLVLKMFNTFSPELMILPAKGKTFDPGAQYFQTLKKNPAVFSYTEVLAENAVLKYRDKQAVGLIKGVSKDYLKNPALDSVLKDGRFLLSERSTDYMVLGSSLQAYLMTIVLDPFNPVQIFSPGKGRNFSAASALSDFTVKDALISGVFDSQQQYNATAFVSLDFARELLSEPVNISSIEINFHKGTNTSKLNEQITNDLGPDYIVQDRLEQNRALYNVLGSEKWMVYMILTFILIIAIFNIIGSLTMLVIEKVRDISILSSLGASNSMIKKIFLLEGMMITLGGCILGLLAGLLFCVLQAEYGLIKMGSTDGFGAEAYPVALKFTDFLLVFLTVSGLSFLASSLASKLSVKNVGHLNQAT